MIGSVAYNEQGIVGVITGCEYEDYEDEQIQYHRGKPKMTGGKPILNDDGTAVLDDEGNPTFELIVELVKKSMEKRRLAYVGRGLDGNPWRAECATPLTRAQKQALGA